MSRDQSDESVPGEVDVRDVVNGIACELDAANQVYADVYAQVAASGELDDSTRAWSIRAIASVATTLRRLAPSLSTLEALPDSDQTRLAVILLRLLTDSLSIALADPPERQLMVAPIEVGELVQDVQAALAREATRP